MTVINGSAMQVFAGVTNGGSAIFHLGDISIDASSGFDAIRSGFAGGGGSRLNGYGYGGGGRIAVKTLRRDGFTGSATAATGISGVNFGDDGTAMCIDLPPPGMIVVIR